MYCTHCGKPLPDDARYCPGCGRELFAQPAAPEESGLEAAAPLPPALDPAAPMLPAPQAAEEGSRTVLYLLMALLSLPQLFWTILLTVMFPGRRLAFFILRDIVQVLVVSVIGGLSVLSLVRRGRILPGRLRGQDLLMWILWSFPASMVAGLCPGWVEDGLGSDIATGFVMARSTEDSFCNLYGFWGWLLVILLCMARSGRLDLTKKTVSWAGILLAGWSLLFSLLGGLVLTVMISTPDAFSWREYAQLTLTASGAALWVRHGFAAAYMVLYGSGRLCPILDLLLAMAPALLTALLTPAAVSAPQLGLYGAELARLAAFVISWALLLLLRRRKEE